MPAKVPGVHKCGVCEDSPSRYKCPSCPIRYCSVACFKQHKASTCSSSTTPSSPSVRPPVLLPSSGPALGAVEAASLEPSSLSLPKPVVTDRTAEKAPLRPLTVVRWPPEPDPDIFTDPLRREDPKPLRREELMRIATSARLRDLLSTPNLPRILRILDALPSPHGRASTLSRLLSIDERSLSRPGGGTFLAERSSPPPLDQLLLAVSGEKKEDDRRGWDEDGWWLGPEGSKEGRVWIGEDEKRTMRLWAGVVCEAIDGGGGGESGWGEGGLMWET